MAVRVDYSNFRKFREKSKSDSSFSFIDFRTQTRDWRRLAQSGGKWRKMAEIGGKGQKIGENGRK